MLRDMFKKTYTKIDMRYRAEEKESAKAEQEDAPVIPAGLWKKCNKCGKPIYTDDVRANYYIVRNAADISVSMRTAGSR